MTKQHRRIILAMQAAEARGQTARIRDLQATLGHKSPATVHCMLQRLIKEGWVVQNKSRRYRVLRQITPIVEIKVWDDGVKGLVPWSADMRKTA